MAEFLLEILAEEIPAGVLPGAREDLLARVSGAFAEARLGGTLSVHSTSRRLVLVGEGVAERQPDATLEVTGPPASRAVRRRGQAHEGRRGVREGAGRLRGRPRGRRAPEGRRTSSRGRSSRAAPRPR